MVVHLTTRERLSVSIDAQIVTELMSYPAEDFTETLAYKVLETSTTKNHY